MLLGYFGVGEGGKSRVSGPDGGWEKQQQSLPPNLMPLPMLGSPTHASLDLHLLNSMRYTADTRKGNTCYPEEILEAALAT